MPIKLTKAEGATFYMHTLLKGTGILDNEKSTLDDFF